MNEQTKKAIHDALTHILLAGPKHRSIGICNNVKCIINDDNVVSENDMYELINGWPEHSGIIAFPIHAKKNRTDNPHLSYLHAKDMFDKHTHYGRARWRLVEYLHEKTKE